jgi:hypothetical protein
MASKALSSRGVLGNRGWYVTASKTGAFQNGPIGKRAIQFRCPTFSSQPRNFSRRISKKVSKQLIHARFRSNPVETARRRTRRSKALSGHPRVPRIRPSDQAVTIPVVHESTDSISSVGSNVAGYVLRWRRSADTVEELWVLVRCLHTYIRSMSGLGNCEVEYLGESSTANAW